MPRLAAPTRLLFVCLVASSAVACGGDGKGVTGSGGKIATYVELQSDAGDYLGGGRSYRYTQSNAEIRLTSQGRLLLIDVDGSVRWSGMFQAPEPNTQLTPGTYAGLTRYPGNDPVKGGLTWYGDGRGCDTLTGSFTVDQSTYAADSLSAIDLRFELHCNEAEPAFRGTIHWNP